MKSDCIELFRSHSEKCIRGQVNEKPRGIILFIKKLIIGMIEFDSDITPKRALSLLTIKRKKEETAGNIVCLLRHLAGLIQVYTLYIYICIIIIVN